MQLIYISIRPDAFEKTLHYIKHFFQFPISNILVFCPKDLMEQYNNIEDVTAIDEIDLLGSRADDFFKTNDHAAKNYLLRSSLAYHPLVEEHFIMCDDDNRPISNIPLEFYYQDGKYHSYYYTMLYHWFNIIFNKKGYSSFDVSLFNELELFRELGFPLYAFQSHMPQIINKAIHKEAIEFFQPFIEERNICLSEWGTYFNYGLKMHPEKFHAPKVFPVIGWPQKVSRDWAWSVVPESIYFENFYETSYEDGGLFEHLSPDFDPSTVDKMTSEKIKIYLADASARVKGNILIREDMEELIRKYQ